MKSLHAVFLATVLALTSGMASAQLPVTAQGNHEALLSSPDPKLARNKKLVYDFWREVVEAGHVEQAGKYVAEGYIQHNPNVETGRAALVEQIAKNVKQQAVQPRLKAPLVAIMAEGNLVMFSLVSEVADPKNPAKKITTTWFDLFRIEDGKIAEHWDSAAKLQ